MNEILKCIYFAKLDNHWYLVNVINCSVLIWQDFLVNVDLLENEILIHEKQGELLIPPPKAKVLFQKEKVNPVIYLAQLWITFT